MAKQSWHGKPNDIGIDLGMARKGTPKQLDPLIIHPGHASRTNTSLGAPPRNADPPDASSALPTAPEVQHGSKKFAVPDCHPHMQPHRADGADYDPASADKIMDQAYTGPADFAPKLHTVPAETKEN